MIHDNDFKNILNYQTYLNEKSITDEEISKYDTFLKNIGDIKNNINILQDDIEKIRNILVNNNVNVRKISEDDKIYFEIVYHKDATNLFNFFKNTLVQIEDIDYDIYKKYFDIIFPDGNQNYLDTEIEIEKNNFNRIHIPIGLPKICQGLGIGKKIYMAVINKIKYVSTNKLDRNLDSVFVWDSLRKEKLLYSFIRKEQMICFDINCKFEYVKNILLNYFKFEIEELKNNIQNNQYILDTDFREKYYGEILKTDLKYLVYKI